MEHLQSAIKAQSIADPILKFTAIIRQLGYAAYLVNDHLSWVSLEFLVVYIPGPVLSNSEGRGPAFLYVPILARSTMTLSKRP